MVTELKQSMPMGIVLERREIDNPWQSFSWRAVAVIPGAPEIDEWRVLAEGPGWTQHHAGTLPLEIFNTETEGYRHNLSTEAPKVYVVLRYDDEAETGIVPFLVTVCAFEAQNYLDGDEDLVEPAPMPEVVAAWLQDFVAEHHVDQPRYKRKRNVASKERAGKPGIRSGHGRH